MSRTRVLRFEEEVQATESRLVILTDYSDADELFRISLAFSPVVRVLAKEAYCDDCHKR